MPSASAAAAVGAAGAAATTVRSADMAAEHKQRRGRQRFIGCECVRERTTWLSRAMHLKRFLTDIYGRPIQKTRIERRSNSSKCVCVCVWMSGDLVLDAMKHCGFSAYVC